MEINSLLGSVRYSEELSLRADHCYIMHGNKQGLRLVSWQLWTNTLRILLALFLNNRSDIFAIMCLVQFA